MSQTGSDIRGNPARPRGSQHILRLLEGRAHPLARRIPQVLQRRAIVSPLHGSSRPVPDVQDPRGVRPGVWTPTAVRGVSTARDTR
eukprot:1013752-Amorphochlora_amoeboformis.AAC.2